MWWDDFQTVITERKPIQNELRIILSDRQLSNCLPAIRATRKRLPRWGCQRARSEATGITSRAKWDFMSFSELIRFPLRNNLVEPYAHSEPREFRRQLGILNRRKTKKIRRSLRSMSRPDNLRPDSTS